MLERGEEERERGGRKEEGMKLHKYEEEPRKARGKETRQFKKMNFILH